MKTEDVVKEGYRIGNVLIRNYTKDARSAQEFSNRVDILRYAACTILGVDFANAQRELKFTQEQSEAHLAALVGVIVEVSERLAERVKEGETKIWTPS